MESIVERDPFDSLAAAVRSNDSSTARDLLREHPGLGSKLDGRAPRAAFGETLLIWAAEAGNLAMIDVLLDRGANLSSRSDWWAGSFGVLDVCPPDLAPALIERGAKIDGHSAARLGMLDQLGALIVTNPDVVHARGGDGQTPLHFARSVDIAHLLIEHGADVDALDIDHESTPAQWMVRDRQDVARFLVARGCRTDVLLAAALGDVDLVRRHLEIDPAAVHTRVAAEYFPMRDPRAAGTIYIWTLGRGKTAHGVAREFGHEAVFEFLIDRSPHSLALMVACELGDNERVTALIAKHSDLPRVLTDAEQRRLAELAEDGDTEAVRRMLAIGWPTGVPGDQGGTALHWAAWHGNVDMVRALIAHRAPIDLRDPNHDGTPLDWALHGSANSWRKQNGDYPAVVDALLRAGSRPPATPTNVAVSDAIRDVLRRHSAQS